jgi:hypothetical protein
MVGTADAFEMIKWEDSLSVQTPEVPPTLDPSSASAPVLLKRLLNDKRKFFIDHLILPGSSHLHEDCLEMVYAMLLTKVVILPEDRGLLSAQTNRMDSAPILGAPVLKREDDPMVRNVKTAIADAVRDAVPMLGKDKEPPVLLPCIISMQYVTTGLYELKNSPSRSNQLRYRDLCQHMENLMGLTFDVNLQEGQPVIFFYSAQQDNIPIPFHLAAGAHYEAVMVLATLFAFGGKTVILDEPGKSFHPTLMRELRDLVMNSPSLQNCHILLITHSSDMISERVLPCAHRCTFRPRTIPTAPSIMAGTSIVALGILTSPAKLSSNFAARMEMITVALRQADAETKALKAVGFQASL